MEYLEYVCVGVCALHFFLSLLTSFISGKRIKKFCDKCHMPVVDGEQHTCDLTTEELEALTQFVITLKRGKQ